jgi:uncharacterized protein (TIGR02145 family)
MKLMSTIKKYDIKLIYLVLILAGIMNFGPLSAQDVMYMHVHQDGKEPVRHKVEVVDSITFSELPPKLVDIEGNEYFVVQIGTQMWMAENLRTKTYSNGVEIPTTTLPNDPNFGTEKYQWPYDGKEHNVPLYGRLYTWHAVVDPSGICPDGWRVPTHEEFYVMRNYLIENGYNYDGTTTGYKFAKSLASREGWEFNGDEGTVGNTDYPSKRNSSGFTAVPSGYRGGNGDFAEMGRFAFYWTQTTGGPDNYGTRVNIRWDRVTWYSIGTQGYQGHAVRCIKE